MSDTYWPRGVSSSRAIYLCLFLLFMGYSRQEYWRGLRFPSAVNHILSILSNMTHPSWVALQEMAHNFFELHRLWSMWSFLLASCDCGFHSGGCGITVIASRWEGLAVGKTGSCYGRKDYAQETFNPIVCWWLGPCSLPVSCLTLGNSVLVSAGSMVGLLVTSKKALCWHGPSRTAAAASSPVPCFIDYTKAFDCVDHNKIWKILKEMIIQDHLTCLLRSLCAGQEATVRTGHGTTDWFKIGKGVHQGCILPPWLFK